MASSCPSLIRTEGILTSAALEDMLDAPSPPVTFRAFSDVLEDAILLALFVTLVIFRSVATSSDSHRTKKACE